MNVLEQEFEDAVSPDKIKSRVLKKKKKTKKRPPKRQKSGADFKE